VVCFSVPLVALMSGVVFPFGVFDAVWIVSIALSNQATRYVGLIGLAIGLLVYRWQVKIGPAANVEAAPTGLAAAPPAISPNREAD